jgi:MFS transporter, DHA1 family, multidrug resistance protein
MEGEAEMNERKIVESRSARGISTLHRAILLGSLSFGILQFSLPIYAKQMGASALDIGGMISIFAVMITIARPLVGWGIDHLGRKLFLVFSFICYAIAMGVFAVAQSINMLFLARFVQGIGSSLLWIPAYTVATELSEHDWGRAVGSVDMSSNRGGFFGSFIGFGLMLLVNPFQLAWKISFIVYGLMTLIASFLIWRGVPETRTVRDAAATEEKNQLDRNRFLRLMSIVLLTSISAAMISPLLMIFLQDKFTTDIRALAMAFLPAAIVYAYLPGYMGGLSDRFGRTPLMAAGLVGAGIVSLLMPLMTSLIMLSALWLLEAVGLSAASPAQGALVADLTGKNVRGTGYGLYTLASGLGLILGPLLGGWLYDAAGHAVPFYVNGITLFIGAALVLWLLGGTREKSMPLNPS